MFDDDFRGTTKNEKNFKRLEELQKEAKRIMGMKSRIFNPSIHIGGSDNTHRSAVVGIEVRSPMTLLTEDLRGAFATMFFLADDVSITNVDNTNNVRIVFGVRDIWSEE